MAKLHKHTETSLTTVSPTQEELDKAREIINGTESSKKSKMACMAHYLKLFPDKDVADSRGQKRTDYLELFVVHQLRSKQAESELRTNFATQSNQHAFADLHWWSKETMDKNLGEKFAAHWRDCGLVPRRPNHLTGSTDPDFEEWGVPQNWERLQESDLRQLMIQNKSAADEDDFAMVMDASRFNRPSPVSGSSSSSTAATEGPSMMMKLKQKIKEARESPEKHARRYHDMGLELKRTLERLIRPYETL